MKRKSIAALCAIAAAIGVTNVACATEVYFSKDLEGMVSDRWHYSEGVHLLRMEGILSLADHVYNGEIAFHSTSFLKLSLDGLVFYGEVVCSENSNQITCGSAVPLDQIYNAASSHPYAALELPTITFHLPSARTKSGEVAYVNERTQPYPSALQVEIPYVDFYLDGDPQYRLNSAYDGSTGVPERGLLHFGTRLVSYFDELGLSLRFHGYSTAQTRPLFDEMQSTGSGPVAELNLGSVGAAGGALSLLPDSNIPYEVNASAATVTVDITISAEKIGTKDRYYLARKSRSFNAGASDYLLPVASGPFSLTIPGSTPAGDYSVVATVLDKGTGGQSTYLLGMFTKTN